jgi:DNA-binding NtrC family response regulator
MGDKISVLIVDDEANYRNTLSKILSVKGYETTIAESGFQALDIMNDREFDAVLMDIKMPAMNGVETYKKMKAIRPEAVVIMMTAFSVENLIEDAIKEGAYAVVRKPFDVDMIINMIEKSKNGAYLAVIDDDPEICKTMKSVMENKGYSTTTCATGEEAISLARKRTQDIFFIDMKMPVLNGLETYLEIKKTNPEAVAVMMTAYREEMDELVKTALQNNAYACLYKPFNMDDVINIIEEVSKSRRKE